MDESLPSRSGSRIQKSGSTPTTSSHTGTSSKKDPLSLIDESHGRALFFTHAIPHASGAEIHPSYDSRDEKSSSSDKCPFPHHGSPLESPSRSSTPSSFFQSGTSTDVSSTGHHPPCPTCHDQQIRLDHVYADLHAMKQIIERTHRNLILKDEALQQKDETIRQLQKQIAKLESRLNMKEKKESSTAQLPGKAKEGTSGRSHKSKHRETAE